LQKIDNLLPAERPTGMSGWITVPGWRMSAECGNSSVGRAQPCQGWGREFESRFPLHFYGWVAEWLCSGLQSRRRRFNSDPSLTYVCPGGGTGRRKGLKIPRGQPRAGSIPAPGTRLRASMRYALACR
jgi:hypothetical protein